MEACDSTARNKRKHANKRRKKVNNEHLKQGGEVVPKKHKERDGDDEKHKKAKRSVAEDEAIEHAQPPVIPLATAVEAEIQETSKALFSQPSMSYPQKRMHTFWQKFEYFCRAWRIPQEISQAIRDRVTEQGTGLFLCWPASAIEEKLRSWLSPLAVNAFFVQHNTLTLHSPGGIVEFGPGTDFWNAPKRFEDNCLVVDDAFLLGEERLGSKLFIRECYAKLCTAIAHTQRTVITGTPGIGKSTFGLLLAALASMGASEDARRQMLSEYSIEMSDEELQWLLQETRMCTEDSMRELCDVALEMMRYDERHTLITENQATPTSLRAHHFEEAMLCVDSLRPQVVMQIYNRGAASATFYIFVNDRCFRATMAELLADKQSMQAVSELLEDPDTLFIVDGGFSMVANFSILKCRTIQVTPPDYELYHGFVENDAQLRYMPLWTNFEISRCRETCYANIPEDVVESRAEWVGNTPRYVFNGDRFRMALDNIIFMSAMMVKRYVELVRAIGDRKYVACDHQIVHMRPLDQFRRPRMELASVKVSETVLAVLLQSKCGTLRELLESSPASAPTAVIVRNQLLELMAHEQLRMHDLAFQVRSFADLTGIYTIRFVTGRANLVPIRVRSYQGLAALQPGQYGLLDGKSFPCIDAVSVLPHAHPMINFFGARWVFFQMAAKVKHNEFGNKLQQMMEMLDCLCFDTLDNQQTEAQFPIKKIALVFVTSAGEFDEFPANLSQSTFDGFVAIQHALKITHDLLPNYPAPQIPADLVCSETNTGK